MTKRLNTCEYFTPQMKKHIREKDINPQAVFDKTIGLLFHGSKLNNTSCVGVMKERSNIRTDNLKQTVLSSQCKIKNSNGVRVPEHLMSIKERCSFCEVVDCSDYMDECYHCKKAFCSNCSFSMYNKNEEQRICICCACKKSNSS